MAWPGGGMEGVMSGPRSGNRADRELVERHLHGDEVAFEELYSRFDRMVFNLALRMAGDAEEAADLTQEIFLRVHRYLGRFRGRSSLKTWVYRVALNRCRSRLRQRARRRRFAGTASFRELRDPTRGPEELAVALDEGRRVQEALARLPPAFREAVVLRDLEGLTYEEIAAAAGLRLGTVRSRIARGRERLRALLEAGPPAPPAEPGAKEESS